MGDILSSGPDRPRLFERWEALPRRARLLIVALVCCGLLGWAVVSVLPTDRPAPAARHKVPYPVHSTRITFVRVTDVDVARRSFRIELRAVTRDPVLVRRVTQEYRALTMELSPAQPVTVRPGKAERVWVTARVTSCRLLPVRARLPFLDVTLRNARASQDLSFIPGDRYARALTRVFRTVCGPAARSRPATG
ncbi:Tat pathway signal sequence domain protein [Streptomyces sp. 891-h]|uniref:Tat pathway signal sequence domain protein n=1 Tax=Streptomyces sp. 891-h TaxID=2720714 RepID=UPI001FA9DFE1|nr:Tat pathway signal sequence domain protein [Streptomyces sp. 891-h]UNZ19970.1 Tat pathway signal sequence domain protein [Streptomyces sp. 891-h]